MDADGVDVQVVSPTPVFFSYDRPATQAAQRRPDLQRPGPGGLRAGGERLIPFCQVPLQDTGCRVPRARTAAWRPGTAASRSATTSATATSTTPASSRSCQHCARRWARRSSCTRGTCRAARALDRWMAQWLTGMPAETHLSILAMILGGVFDRVPETLRICFAHGGGSFAFWLGRVENAWHRRADVVATLRSCRPRATCHRFYVDSVVFDPARCGCWCDTLGADQVMVGSDYPYPLGERPVGSVVHRSEFLDADERELIRGRTRNASWA